MGISSVFQQGSLGDLRGGAVSAAVAIPLAMGFGMFAFVSLGDAFFGHGVLAGLWSALVVAVVCVVMGNGSTTVYAPRITSTFYLGSVLFGLTQSPLPQLHDGGVPAVLATFFGIVFLGGAFQALFGVVRLGTLIKFTPHPVMAGFQNAAALLLLLVQASTLLGMERTVPFTQVPAHLAEAHPLSLVVVAVTVVVTWNAKRWAPRLPPVLLGLAVGTIAWYGLVLLGLRDSLGPVIGDMPAQLLEPMDWHLLAGLLPTTGFAALASVMVFAALGLAFIASMDALLCERILAGAGGTPRDSDAQLVRLGLGNMAAALCGGITSGVNLGPSGLNRAQGSRSAASVLVNAVVILLTVLFLMPVLARLPRVVLSAVIVVVAIQHFDPWTVQLVRRLATQRLARRSSLGVELGVVLVVALLSILVNIVTAVFIGVLIAVAMFLLRMSRSVIRRSYRCDTVHSHKTRAAPLMALLAQQGQRIVVFELEGPIFFGTGERLAGTIRGAVGGDTFAVVLDFRRVTDIDSTGATVLLQLFQGLAAAHCTIRLSGLQRQADWTGLLNDLGVLSAIPGAQQFADVDRAIESAEDALLASLADTGAASQAVPFEELDLLRDLQPAELESVRSFLSQRRFEPGEVLFREGDPGTELFIITEGCASLELRQGDATPIRLASFAPGTTFGEMAILDRHARSATVVADGPLTCYVLTGERFSAMQASEPAIALRLVMNLGRELSRRMRRANQMVHEMAA